MEVMDSRGYLMITLTLIFYACLLLQSSAEPNKERRIMFNVISVGNCTKDGRNLLNYPRNVKITKVGRDKVVVNMEQVYTQDLPNARILVEIFKCTDRDGNQCEYFLKVPMSACEYIEAKNQFWTPIFDAISPPLNCRKIKAGIYKVTNSSVDTAKLVESYKNMPNLGAFQYYWKFRTAFVVKNTPAMCIDHVVKIEALKA